MTDPTPPTTDTPEARAPGFTSDLKEVWSSVDYLDGLLQGLELRIARVHRKYGPSGAMPYDYVLRKHLEHHSPMRGDRPS
jgi:hypothetical protein